MHVHRANYEVLRQLGEGGIGRVYEAIHRPSGRIVAIKTLRTEHGGPSSQRLLLNEASAAAQLAHPSIVELIDVGRDDEGAMFLVMELVRGWSLEHWEQGFPGLAIVLRAFDQILDALSTAHAQGIVHGDLKPANVLLDESGRVKITDFGIAHVIDPLKGSERRGVQGTPYYMAPEQLIDLESIGPSTDLYAVGVMLYELVAGHEPYPSEGTLGEMLARKMHAVTPLVPRPGLSIPRELAELVMALLNPDPRLRPRFATGVRQSLAAIAARVVEGEPSSITARALASWIESPLASAPTISSSAELPISHTSTRNLPFSLPAAGGMSPEVALHKLRPLPLLGRDAQVAHLLTLAEHVTKKGGARGMVVAGRPGEGKTRLVRHAFGEVERLGWMIGAAASFDETIASSQAGLRSSMARLLGAPMTTLDDTLAGRWKWLTHISQRGVDFARMHEWLLPGAPPVDVEIAARLAGMCVLAASRVHPVFLWLDDVAWSRDGAMELMLRLLQANDARALIVGTLRSGTAEHPAVRAWLMKTAKAGADFEMLPALSVGDRVTLLDATAKLAPGIARKLADVLDEPTLVLVETVRAWIDERMLVPSDEGYVFAPHASLEELTTRARGSVLMRRITTLLDAFEGDRANAERVLCHAALLGLRFEERVLRACVGAGEQVDLVLDRALLSGLLRVDGRGAYRFEHRLFLDVIVERCAARSDSVSIFRSTANALVGVYGKRNADSGLAIAMLYRAGNDHDSAAEVALSTIRALSRASLPAAADRAIGLFSSWIEGDKLPPTHRHRAMLERARGLRYYFGLDYPTARAHLERARALYEALGDIEEMQSALFDISSTHFYQDHFAETAKCLALVQSATDTTTLTRLHHRLGELAALRCDIHGSLVHFRESARTAERSTDPYQVFVGHATLADTLIGAGEIEEATRSIAIMSKTLETVADRHLVADATRTLAALDAARGYYAAARARMTPHIAELVSRGDAWHATADRAVMLMCAAALGDEDVTKAAYDFIDAYTAVAHDEPVTWWAVRCAASWLRGSGKDALARDVETVLDARMANIALAFDDVEPVTEDAGASSTAAIRASTR